MRRTCEKHAATSGVRRSIATKITKMLQTFIVRVPYRSKSSENYKLTTFLLTMSTLDASWKTTLPGAESRPTSSIMSFVSCIDRYIT